MGALYGVSQRSESYGYIAGTCTKYRCPRPPFLPSTIHFATARQERVGLRARQAEIRSRSMLRMHFSGRDIHLRRMATRFSGTLALFSRRHTDPPIDAVEAAKS